MTGTSMIADPFHERLRASSKRLFLVGLAMIVLGIAAIVFPMISTLVAALLVGWALLLSGGLVLLGYFSIHGTGPFFGAVLFSLLSIAAGTFLVFNPLAGAVALTLLLGGIFAVHGAFEISFALEIRPHRGWVVMLLSGVIAISMALLIAIGWPGISAFLLGLLLGVNFLSTGLGFLSISRALRPPPGA
jgi:uncharacterized membrane protein HdeD (DUF308 family)